MKHPHKCRRGKHFTKGKYKSLVYTSEKTEFVIKRKKVRKTSTGRVKTVNEIYKVVMYKIKYNKVKVIKIKKEGD